VGDGNEELCNRLVFRSQVDCKIVLFWPRPTCWCWAKKVTPLSVTYVNIMPCLLQNAIYLYCLNKL